MKMRRSSCLAAATYRNNSIYLPTPRIPCKKTAPFFMVVVARMSSRSDIFQGSFGNGGAGTKDVAGSRSPPKSLGASWSSASDSQCCAA